jgi:hypothetical protein
MVLLREDDMHEERWLACTDPLEMLEILRGKASERKRRLFAVACARQLWQLLIDERSRKAVEVSERYADGFANDEERNAAGYEGYNATADAERAARNTVDEAIQVARYAAADAASCAYHAGYCDDWGDTRTTSAAALRARLKVGLLAGPDAGRLAQCQMLRDLFGNLFHPIAISSV